MSSCTADIIADGHPVSLMVKGRVVGGESPPVAPGAPPSAAPAPRRPQPGTEIRRTAARGTTKNRCVSVMGTTPVVTPHPEALAERPPVPSPKSRRRDRRDDGVEPPVPV